MTEIRIGSATDNRLNKMEKDIEELKAQTDQLIARVHILEEQVKQLTLQEKIKIRQQVTA